MTLERRPRTDGADPAREERTFSLSRVIALMNQKGGVGKTTTTVNLAAALARRGRPTLLIDMDPQAHATLHLGVEPADRGSVYDVLVESERAESVVIPRGDGLAIIPSVTDLAAAESELAGLDDRESRLARSIEPIKSGYEFILIDCPPSLGLLTLNALAAAREVIVPMQAHFLALQGLGKLLETVHGVGGGVNPRLRVSGVVLCMHEETTKHSREVVADIERFFADSSTRDVPWRGARVYKPPIRRNIKLAECPSFGQTVFEYAPGCPGASDYERLADSMIAEWDALLARRHAEGGAVPAVQTRRVGPAAEVAR